MLGITNTVLRSDFTHLSKDNLKSICIDLNLPDDGTMNDLTNRIWTTIKDNEQSKERALSAHVGRLYAGKVAITWYGVSSGASLAGSKRKIEGFAGINPFENFYVPSNLELTSEPVIIGAVCGANDHSYYLRFMYKAGIRQSYYGNDVVENIAIDVVTVYVDESTNLIEVRATSKKAKKIIEKLARIIEQEVTIYPRDIMNKYGSNIEEIATQVNGRFIDTTAKPELLIKDFGNEKANSVLSMLRALDGFFEDNDIEALGQALETSRESLGEDAANMPFTALVLAGLDQIGLCVGDRDLRENQLYNYLNEYMQHQGGYIELQCLGNSYTIQVGSGTNSITFKTPANEDVIKYVRERIILG